MSSKAKAAIVAVLSALLIAVVYFSWPITEPIKRNAPDIDWGEMERREVKKGQHLFRPSYGWHLTRRRPGWTMLLQPDSATWYDPARLGNDGNDWSKLGGVSYFDWWKPSTWAFNRNSALGAFKPLPVPYTFGFAGYTNLLDGSHKAGEIVTARAGDRVKIDYDYFNGVAVFELWVNDTGYYTQVLPIDVARVQITVPAWHGGQQPAPENLSFQSVLKLK